jgi:hypothetical protein
MPKEFPIQDIQWHEEALRSMPDFELSDREATISVCWHSTAIAYLHYGAFHGLDGPGVEIDKVPVRIKPYFQLGIDSYKQPFMRHFLPETLDATDEQVG